MTKTKKIIISVISIVLVVAIGIVAAILIVNDNKAKKQATTVMACSVNPSIQFVLNAKDDVIDVIATNEDGQAIILKGEFVGLSAEEAAELFISLSTEAGYIDAASVEGTKVTINFNGTRENYDKLKASVVEQVNNYFDENGIVAGAVATVSKNLEEAIKNVNADAKDLANKTSEQLMEEYLKVTDELEGISYTLKDAFYAKYDELLATYNSAKASAEAAITKAEADIADAQAKIDQAPESLKAALQPTLDLAKQALETAKTQLTQATTAFETGYNQAIEYYKQESEKAFATLKADIEAKIAVAKQKLAERKAYAEANRDAVQAQIDAFRQTLAA